MMLPVMHVKGRLPKVIAATSTCGDAARRTLHLLGMQGRRRFMIDTIADVSVVPSKYEDVKPPNPYFHPQAASRCKFSTYGHRTITLDIGRGRTQ